MTHGSTVPTADATTAPLMLRLKEETLPNHQAAESGAFEQMLVRGQLTREQYVALLQQRYLMHAALERAVVQLAATHPFVANIVRSGLLQQDNLRQDLQFFGVQNPDAGAPCAGTRSFIDAVQRAAAERPISLLGFYYVFEGSKNGAKFISRAIRSVFSLTQDGVRYLDPHGDQQRALWMEFKQSMDAAPIPAADHEAIIDAAKRTFDFVAQVGEELLAQPA